MDIAELSRKMEANFLDTHSNISNLKPNTMPNFCHRLTRSQAHKNHKPILEEAEVHVQPKKSNRKVDEAEKIYLNKAIKIVHKNLETIYEDPILKKGSTLLLGTNKVKRSILLDREFRITSKQKSKLRKKKIKRFGKKTKPFKISDEEFKNKMLKIENYINGNDVEIEYKNEDCDIEFENIEVSESNESNIKKNVNLALRNNVISE